MKNCDVMNFLEPHNNPHGKSYARSIFWLFLGISSCFRLLLNSEIPPPPPSHSLYLAQACLPPPPHTLFLLFLRVSFFFFLSLVFLFVFCLFLFNETSWSLQQNFPTRFHGNDKNLGWGGGVGRSGRGGGGGGLLLWRHELIEITIMYGHKNET